MKPQFAVSLMCMDFLNIREQLDILNRRADYYHIDLMDGHFCKNITLSPDIVAAISRAATLPMDAHLMATTPNDWLEPMAKAGAKIISPHAETINTDAFRVLNRIEQLGCKKGVVLNPATTFDTVRHYIGRLDILTIMTVDVGYAGQAFIPEMLKKIEEAANFREKQGYRYLIQVDGSCNARTYKRLNDAGTDIYVMGSSGLFGLSKDLNEAYDKMLADFHRETGL